MVPARLVPLPRLPVTVQGKLDHRALPDPALSPAPPFAAGSAPIDALEADIAATWATALGFPAFRSRPTCSISAATP